MIFHKKGRLKKVTDRKLWDSLTQLKEEWMNNKTIIEKSVEPSDELLLHLKVSEVKYFYLLKEAKIRKLTAEKK
ncbi:YaaL family protein [Calidifontibacillus oryziterrae]|uniref:YaaL family protein n=1 Tax=Calidifontibacillus oryziterrae TaxID=1191699 RepID=UPI0002EFF86B|nr:YaaL family protein [Calidifontibacillus oryziterrae]